MILLVYVVSLAALPTDGFWINDNGCKFVLMEGIIRSDYQAYDIPWPGREIDPAFVYNPIRSPFGHVCDGKLFCTFSPVFALLSSVPFRLLGSYGLYLLPLLGGVLTVPGVWVLAGMVATSPRSRRIAQPLSVVLAALATPMWFYSLTFWEHTPAVCLATWSVVCCMRFVLNGNRSGLVLGAVLCGMSVYFRDEMVLFAVVLGAVTVTLADRRRRTAWVYGIALTLSIVPLLWFQHAALGTWIGFHLSSDSVFGDGLAGYLIDRWTAARNLLFASHATPFLSMVLTVPYVVLLLMRPRVGSDVFRRVVPVLGGAALVGGVVVIAGHLLADSPMRWVMSAGGLFATSPVLVFALVRCEKPRGRRSPQDPRLAPRARVGQALWLIVLVFAMLYVALTPTSHSAGIHWGCRYLLCVFPLLAVLAGSSIATWLRLTRKGGVSGRAVIGAVVGLSVLTQVYAVHLLWAKKQHSSMLNQTIARRTEDVIVTPTWFLPQTLARVFYDKPIFQVRDPAGGERLLTLLRKAGYRSALVIQSPPAPRQASTTAPAVKRSESRIIEDDALHFMPIELLSVPLDDQTP